MAKLEELESSLQNLSQIKESREAYIKALAESQDAGNAAVFMDFIILRNLQERH